MNARQMKKRLKKQIDRLKSDNDLMRRIIANSPEMQELYDAYTKPLNVIHTTIPLQEFKAKRILPVYTADAEELIEHTKQAVTKDLFECVKENIIYKIETECATPTITAIILVGRKERANEQ